MIFLFHRARDSNLAQLMARRAGASRIIDTQIRICALKNTQQPPSILSQVCHIFSGHAQGGGQIEPSTRVTESADFFPFLLIFYYFFIFWPQAHEAGCWRPRRSDPLSPAYFVLLQGRFPVIFMILDFCLKLLQVEKSVLYTQLSTPRAEVHS